MSLHKLFNKMKPQPKIFISYSWTSPSHEDWVISLAERLSYDGVDVIIDKWYLKEGQDKYVFMENMVKSDDIQKVLIILDSIYTEKAEDRKGGVGTETQIISPQIYEDVSQEKFVPIITEKDDNEKPFMPTFLQNRIFIDLSDQNHFEENYEKLLRNIFQRPAFRKPKTGIPPSYLFDETPMTHKTSIIVRSFDNQIEKQPLKLNSIIREFLDALFNDLKSYSINSVDTRDPLVFGKIIHDNIISLTPLRNDYISLIDKALKTELEFDIEIFIKFFEKLPLLKSELEENSKSLFAGQFDNFKFFIHEVFLYTIAVGLKNEKYKFIEEIMYSSYFFKSRYYDGGEAKRYPEELYNVVNVFDSFYQEAYSKNLHSPMADFMMSRIYEGISKELFIEADLLAHYISSLDNIRRWFPITYIYKKGDNYELFGRLVSHRHFVKVKCLFGVNTTSELKDKLSEYELRTNKINNNVRFSGHFDSVTPIYKLIDISKIGIIR